MSKEKLGSSINQRSKDRTVGHLRDNDSEEPAGRLRTADITQWVSRMLEDVKRWEEALLCAIVDQ